MRYYSLFATSGHLTGRARRRTAVTTVLAVGGVLAGMVPAMAAHASVWHRPLVFHPPRVVYGGVPAGQARGRRFTVVNRSWTFTGRLTFAPDHAARYRARLIARGRKRIDSGVITVSTTGNIAAFPTTAASYTAQVNAGVPASDHATVPLAGTATAALVQSVSAGGLHTCAVKTDHTLWCWGSNFYGQLGDGSTTNRTAPVQVSGHATDWAAVAAGASHTCAVRTDHTLWCWGLNGNGEFGNGTTTDSPVPVQVGGHTADWAAVAAGTGNTCAVKTDHTLWCWGSDFYGQLGDGSTTNRTAPVQVSGHATDWAAVAAGAAGASHICAVRANGTLWCWGDNTYDQLGDGTTTGSPVPVQVSGHATDWAAVTAGGIHTCAVKTDHTLWCWGDNTYGQVGDGSTTTRTVPVQVSGHATDWAAVG
jgi:hypothetical protein